MIETERLILRNWTIDDAESMFKYASDPDVGPHAGWAPHESIEFSRKIVSDFAKCPNCFAICLKESGEPIGCIELKTPPCDLTDKSDESELGYWIGKPYWNKGYMTEAARAVIKYGFETLNLRAIWCGYYDGNDRSKRVQEKLGFEHHHRAEGIYLSALNETRAGNANLMTKEKWLEIKE